MAFFPHQFYNDSPATFGPLFRLLDDFDSYSRQGNNGGRRSGLTQFQPKFDVRETGDVYELHGELPGMSKDNVHIEFTEPQVMLIRGKVERTYTAGTPPAGHLEDSNKAGAITQGEEHKNSHKATVEDEQDESNNAEASSQASQSTSSEVAKQGEQQKQPADKAKYWLTERSIGEFSRSFNFPTRVDQDNVSASFKDGILNITVPKAKKHESRRITVN